MSIRCRRIDSVVELTEKDIKRALGITIPLAEVKKLLERSGIQSARSRVRPWLCTLLPSAWISDEGIVGVADVMEEIARMYGYENIPESRMADPLPPQRGNPSLEGEEHVRDLLVSLGMQEIITHRMTSPELEQRLVPDGNQPVTEQDYVRLANPIAPDKTGSAQKPIEFGIECGQKQ